ncbi:uncharacterized protein LOC122636955 isoform X1 [Vespula pensylvanica]|uniref:uncharacterized protein LOC122636955 isoform X1 n=2 Tax=Vespula pensylvanica TaxID=30213 RepID=UPI001CBA2999|nr:uncharacterized protein LOC122636955 isoform X1 [Vespula pensylvanica]
MDRGFKQILWMTWTLRNRTLFLNYTIRSRITRTTLQNYWNSSKDIYRSVKLEPIKKIILESYTLSSVNATHILDCINNQCSDMDLKDMLDILTILTKIVNEDGKQFNLRNHKGFKILCEKLQKQIRNMNVSDVVQVIKLLNFLDIPASTMLMQNLLQIIRNSINELDIHQIHLLLIILKKMEDTPLSSALLIALPILIPNILSTKLDYLNLKELSLALLYIKYVERRDLTNKIYKSIESLLMYDSRNVSVSTLKYIFISLCTLSNKTKFVSDHFKTMEIIRQALFQKINKLTPTDILECIIEICKNVIEGRMIPYSYNTTFINELLNVAITKNMDPKICFDIANFLNNISYIYIPFIEFMINEHVKEDVMKQIRSHNLKTILRTLSNAEYQSVPWFVLENKFLDETFIKKCSIQTLLKYALDLAALNRYYPKMLSTIFTNIDKKILISFTDLDFKRLLLLYQSVKTLYPDYLGPWFDKDEFYMYHISEKVSNELRETLERAMGGPQYVLSYLKTKIGHNINHAIIMRKGGFPIAFNTYNSDILAKYTHYVEELQCTQENFVILIVEFPSVAYSINTQKLLGVRNLQIKTIEKWTGHRCVSINMKVWFNLPSHERVTHIMQKIKDKYPEIMETT